MDDFKDIPMGFGMALLQNKEAADFFSSLNDAQKKAVINQTHMIHSKEDMKAFVKNLPSMTL